MIPQIRKALYSFVCAILVFCIVLPVRGNLDVVYAADELPQPVAVEIFTGSFTTSYPIPVPPAVEGPVPGVTLNYNSGRVWGSSDNTNGQAGQQGMGWQLEPGSITLYTFKYWIADDWYLSTNGSLFISLNGVQSKLVNVSGNLYRLESDPNWKVELLTSSETGHPDTTNKNYWLVTTPDGTKYRFGGEFEPTSENPTGSRDQNSVAYVPLGGPGYPIFPNPRAYKWYLDRVEDVQGNVINYYYGFEDNWYVQPGTSTRLRYIRATHLRYVEYTKKAGQVAQPHARILFNMELRCTDNSSVDCPNAANLPDAPIDLLCHPFPAEYGPCSQTLPSFWSDLRLDSIQTQVYDQTAATWQTSAVYDLNYTFPTPPGSGSSTKLWLSSIEQRAGGNFNRLAFSQIEAESADVVSQLTPGEAGIEPGLHQYIATTGTTGFPNGYIQFRNVDFGSGSNQALIRHHIYESTGTGTILEVRLDSPTGTLIGQVMAATPYFWKTGSITITNTSGVHDLYVIFKKPNLAVNWLRFLPTDPLPVGSASTEYTHAMLEGGVAEDNYLPVISAVETQQGPGQGEVFNITYGQTHPCMVDFTTVRPPFDCFRDIWGEQHRIWKVTKLTKHELSNVDPSEIYTYTYTAPTWNYMKYEVFDIDSTCWTDQPVCAKRNWNDFRGHALVTETNTQGEKTEYRFYQGMNGDRFDTSGGIYTTSIILSDNSTRVDVNWLRGKLAETREFNDNNELLARTVYGYTDTVTAGSGDTAARIVILDKEERTLYCPCSLYISAIKLSKTD